MIQWLSNLKIAHKFLFLFMIVFGFMVCNTIGIIEIAKTGYLQFLEREHIELAGNVAALIGCLAPFSAHLAPYQNAISHYGAALSRNRARRRRFDNTLGSASA